MTTGTRSRCFTQRAVTKTAKRKEQDGNWCAASSLCALARKKKHGYVVDCCVLPCCLFGRFHPSLHIQSITFFSLLEQNEVAANTASIPKVAIEESDNEVEYRCVCC